MNFLASPPLVVAYALAGQPGGGHHHRTAGHRQRRQAGVPRGHLAERRRRSQETVPRAVDSAMFTKGYASVFHGRCELDSIKTPAGKIYAWDARLHLRQESALLRRHDHDARHRSATSAARARWRCSAIRSPPTTSRRPATSPSPARPREYLIAQGVQAADFNSYGARRGNHEVMMRGTFANIRLRNLLLPGTEGGVTVHIPSGEADVDLRCRDEVQGRRHAAGDPRRQGIRHRQFARLGRQGHDAAGRQGGHRRELRAHPPLQSDRHGRAAAAVHADGQNAQSLGLTGRETFEIVGLERGAAKTVTVVATPDGGKPKRVRGAAAHRYAEGARLLPARRHPAVRAAPARAAPARPPERGAGACCAVLPAPPPAARRAAGAGMLPASTSTIVAGFR